jgi:hypothetical protein
MTQDSEFAALVHQLDGMVEAVAGADIDQSELRRVLRFISQVIQVIEQAYQEVFSLLVEMKYLTAGDIGTPRLAELGKQVDLLTAKSSYRDAWEICNRLKYLEHVFNSTMRSSLEHLPQFGQWAGVLGLIRDHEGYVIRMIGATAEEMSGQLAGLTPHDVPELNRTAAQRAARLRTLLGELHELNGRILGHSGKEGLLELTRDKQQLEKEIRIMVDQRDFSVTHGPRITAGDHSHIEISNSFNAVQSMPDSGLKEQLALLVTQVQALADKLPPEKQAEVRQDLDSLVAEAVKPQPRKRWYELSASGLKEAAEACEGVASPVIATVAAVMGLLAG